MKATFLVALLLFLNGWALAEPGPIRIGRFHQLFLDDYLIESTEHLTRRVQPARKDEANPHLVREHDWEPAGYVLPSVIYDEEEKIYKAWLDGVGPGVFYFTSQDGLHWQRPELRLFPEFDAGPTNRVVLSGFELDQKAAPPDKLAYLRSRERGWTYFSNMGAVIKDRRDPDPARRYKMAYLWMDRNFTAPGAAKPGKFAALGVAFSPDGVHWTPMNEPVSRATEDVPLHIIFDEDRRRWVLYGRIFGVIPEEKKAAYAADPDFRYNMGRAVRRAESEDFVHWTPDDGELVLASDLQESANTEIYSLRPIPYEGVHIGLVHVFHNDPEKVWLALELGISRDGKSWQRLSDRTPFLPPGGLGEWDRAVISPPSGDALRVGDELRFYYSGRNVQHITIWNVPDNPKLLPDIAPYRGAMGFASVKRDRFVAMEASFQPGVLRTKLFIHEGGTLHVNAAVKFGALTVSVLDEQGATLQKATVLSRDELDLALPELTGLRAPKGEPVRLEFAVQNGRLFSFWIQ